MVDDDPFVQQVIGDVLKEEGYSVLFASSGNSMLKLLETEQPALIVLDMMMPNGHGWDAFHAIESQPRLCDIPVIVISTGLASERTNALRVPCLQKPFDLEHLLRMVKETIGEPGSLSSRDPERRCHGKAETIQHEDAARHVETLRE